MKTLALTLLLISTGAFAETEQCETVTYQTCINLMKECSERCETRKKCWKCVVSRQEDYGVVCKSFKKFLLDEYTEGK